MTDVYVNLEVVGKRLGARALPFWMCILVVFLTSVYVGFFTLLSATFFLSEAANLVFFDFIIYVVVTLGLLISGYAIILKNCFNKSFMGLSIVMLNLRGYVFPDSLGHIKFDDLIVIKPSLFRCFILSTAVIGAVFTIMLLGGMALQKFGIIGTFILVTAPPSLFAIFIAFLSVSFAGFVWLYTNGQQIYDFYVCAVDADKAEVQSV